MAEAETLIYNPEKIDKLGNVIQQQKRNFDDAIDAMFKVIDSDMNNIDHWTGSAYDEFKTKCDNFRSSSIETMSNRLNNYSKHFASTSEKAEETTNNNINRVKDETNIDKVEV